MGSSAFLKVTDLVASRLRMSDTRIATLTGNIIKGKEDGRTEIQVQYIVEISYLISFCLSLKKVCASVMDRFQHIADSVSKFHSGNF